jgi:hypothetical protein
MKLNTNFTLGADGELHHSMDNNFPVIMLKHNQETVFAGLNTTNNFNGGSTGECRKKDTRDDSSFENHYRHMEQKSIQVE